MVGTSWVVSCLKLSDQLPALNPDTTTTRAQISEQPVLVPILTASPAGYIASIEQALVYGDE